MRSETSKTAWLTMSWLDLSQISTVANNISKWIGHTGFQTSIPWTASGSCRPPVPSHYRQTTFCRMLPEIQHGFGWFLSEMQVTEVSECYRRCISWIVIWRRYKVESQHMALIHFIQYFFQPPCGMVGYIGVGLSPGVYLVVWSPLHVGSRSLSTTISFKCSYFNLI